MRSSFRSVSAISGLSNNKIEITAVVFARIRPSVKRGTEHYFMYASSSRVPKLRSLARHQHRRMHTVQLSKSRLVPTATLPPYLILTDNFRPILPYVHDLTAYTISAVSPRNSVPWPPGIVIVRKYVFWINILWQSIAVERSEPK